MYESTTKLTRRLRCEMLQLDRYHPKQARGMAEESILQSNFDLITHSVMSGRGLPGLVQGRCARVVMMAVCPDSR